MSRGLRNQADWPGKGYLAVAEYVLVDVPAEWLNISSALVCSTPRFLG